MAKTINIAKCNQYDRFGSRSKNANNKKLAIIASNGITLGQKISQNKIARVRNVNSASRLQTRALISTFKGIFLIFSSQPAFQLPSQAKRALLPNSLCLQQ